MAEETNNTGMPSFEEYVRSLSNTEERDSLNFLRYRNEFTNYYRDRRPTSDPLVTGYQYTFFTAPELSLDTNDSKYREIVANNRSILNISGLTIYNQDIIDMLSGKYPFMPVFTNRCASSITSDESLTTIDYGETFNKYKLVIGTTTKDSKIGGSFTLNLHEDSDLIMLKLHKLWVEYIDRCFMGDVIPISSASSASDLLSNSKRTIDYVVSIFQFSTLPDGETLSHWCRYVGVFPTKIPYGEFTVEDGSFDIKKTLPFEYNFSYKEDLSIYTLNDFNLISSGEDLSVSKKSSYTGAKIESLMYNTNKDVPRIVESGSGINKKFKLIFPEVDY